MHFLRTLKQFAFVIIALSFLPSCAQTDIVSHWWKKSNHDRPSSSLGEGGSYKVGKPYKVEGAWYTPKEDFDLVETGIASWYGNEFKGKPTANGETFDPNALTAAHRTLQMPSIIRVTNLGNGRSVVLRVNDRGPFARGRVLDVSRRGAELLGYKNQGTAKVRIEVLKNESMTVAQAAKGGASPNQQLAMLKQAPRVRPGTVRTEEPLSAPVPSSYVEPAVTTVQSQDLAPIAGQIQSSRPVPMHAENGVVVPDEIVTKTYVAPNSIYVQVGSFTQISNAQNVQTRLGDVGNVQITPAVVNGTHFNRVRVGPIATVEEADKILNRTLDRGYTGAKIVVE